MVACWWVPWIMRLKVPSSSVVVRESAQHLHPAVAVIWRSFCVPWRYLNVLGLRRCLKKLLINARQRSHSAAAGSTMFDILAQ
jgi:hypothetical protein